jgi:hypothetical protein
MKEIFKDKIINIDTNIEDKKFLIKYLDWDNKQQNCKIIFLKDLLEKEKNEEILKKVKEKPAMWEQIYSRKTEFKIFEKLFNEAIINKEKIHIV